MPDEQDDAIAKALAEAGLSADLPGAPADDPLARAFAAAGLSVPADPEPDPEPEPVVVVVPGPSVVRERTAEAEAPELPRWPAGVATGVGSMPGTDVRESAAIVVGEVPGMPALPELPARGVGADMIGRTAALLVDIPFELKASRWTVARHPGRDRRRAVDLLRSDMDAFDEACDPIRPDWLKVAVTGPWTLVAAAELASGHRVLTDRGAVREFAESLLEGLRSHVAEVAARSGAHVVVQLDEPGLPAVLAGSLPTQSGLERLPPVRDHDVQDLLRELVEPLTALGSPVVIHCCADLPPLPLLLGTGAAAFGIDATLPSLRGRTAQVAALDAVGEVWDAGVPLLLGLVPSTRPVEHVDEKTGAKRPLTSLRLARTAFDLADRLGFARERLGELAVPTPACGLAGADPAWAKQALGFARELGAGFVDPPDTAPGEQ